MSRIVPASLVALFSIVALHAADVSGTWVGGPFCIILKQDGNKLTGSGGPTKSKQFPFDSGSIEGDRILLTLGPVTFDLRIEGDEIKGQVKAQEQSSPLYMKRLVVRPPGAPAPEFDVASVKRASIPAGGRFMPSMKSSPGRVNYSQSLRNLILRAYDLKDYQLSGPDWMRFELYDVTATMPPATSPEDLQLMFQTLLKDRFKMDIRRETKTLPVYGLVPGRGGSKMKEVPLGFGRGSYARGAVVIPCIDMPGLAQFLSSNVDRPVLDMTDLKGFFEVKLNWTPEELRRGQGEAPKDGAAMAPDLGPSIFTAVQEQLGLSLSPRNAPVEMVIVDRAEKIPTEN